MEQLWFQIRYGAGSSVLLLLAFLIFCPGAVNASETTSRLLESQSFLSEALKGPLNYSIYLPPGAEAASQAYPVLFLLHGLGGSEKDWVRAGGVRKTTDRLIKSGEINPLIIVIPDGASSWYVNSAARKGPGDYETALLRDLPDHIEASYPVRQDKPGRSIGGLSMGGFGAVRLGLIDVDRFPSIVSLSGAIVRDDTPDHPVSNQQIKLFRQAFGVPYDKSHFNRDNVFSLAERVNERVKTGKAEWPQMLLVVGDDDYFKLYRGAFHFFDHMRGLKAPVELRINDGKHTWPYWNRELARLLRFANAYFE